MKVAVIHDWLVVYSGAERVLTEILALFPQADLFSVVDFLPAEDRVKLSGKQARTTFVQRLPWARRRYRGYLPLMPIAVEQLDLSAYDLIISSSHAVAKGVLTGPDQLHISYVHSPIRYAWDLQHQYLQEAGLARGLKSILARLLLHYVRLWDQRTSTGVDHFIANSQFISRRIRKAYGRDAAVIYPPVDTELFTPAGSKENFYLVASRMVPYKRIPLIVEAFRGMPEKQLVVIGDGPDFSLARKCAASAPNIQLLGYQPLEVLRDHMRRAKAFVFAAEEDFGIAPVEAMACGTPVIAYGRGGVLETVDATTGHASGIFYEEQSVDALRAVIERFEAGPSISAEACRTAALRFSSERFREAFGATVQRHWDAHCADRVVNPKRHLRVHERHWG